MEIISTIGRGLAIKKGAEDFQAPGVANPMLFDLGSTLPENIFRCPGINGALEKTV